MFDQEQIEMLAKAERDMDSGKTKFVVNSGQRWMFPDEVFGELGLESGQNVSDSLLIGIMQHNIASLKTTIAIEKAKKAANK